MEIHIFGKNYTEIRLRGHLNIKMSSYQYRDPHGISIMNVRHPIFVMEIPIFEKKYTEIRLRGHLNIKMSSYQYRDPHVKDKTVSRPSYL